MAISPGGIGTATNLFGGAVQSLFGAQASRQLAAGDFAAAGDYTTASKIAQQNERIARSSTEIQEAQLNRKIEQTIGTQIADVGGAGFVSESGSAGDLFRSSMQQGALAKMMVESQGQINVNAYAQQASAYNAMASQATAGGNAAKSSAKGQQAAGILGAIGGVLAIGAMFI